MQTIACLLAGTGRTRLQLDIYEMGSDLLAVLVGAGPHIGAASLCEPHAGGSPESADVVARGHREGELTRRLSRALARITGRRTLALAGIHLDRIAPAEIQAIRANVTSLIAELPAALTAAERGMPQ